MEYKPMVGADSENIRQRIDAIIAPLFLRPRRSRELSDELYDHALEATEAGEDNPVASLGQPRVIRGSINRFYFLKTLFFATAFLLLFALWRTYWIPMISGSPGFRIYFPISHTILHVLHIASFSGSRCISFSSHLPW